jgi:hypothetical protein
MKLIVTEWICSACGANWVATIEALRREAADEVEPVLITCRQCGHNETLVPAENERIVRVALDRKGGSIPS